MVIGRNLLQFEMYERIILGTRNTNVCGFEFGFHKFEDLFLCILYSYV